MTCYGMLLLSYREAQCGVISMYSIHILWFFGHTVHLGPAYTGIVTLIGKVGYLIYNYSFILLQHTP